MSTDYEIVSLRLSEMKPIKYMRGNPIPLYECPLCKDHCKASRGLRNHLTSAHPNVIVVEER